MKNKIKEMRKATNTSQLALSQKVGVSRQTINAIENNKYNPTLELAFDLAKELKTTVDELSDASE